MISYLSIDLDYWAVHKDVVKDINHSTRFFRKIKQLNIPMYVVYSHEQLLPHINENECECLYNIDYHSDISGYFNVEEKQKWLKKNKPVDGTWAMFVDWRKKAKFVWRYPDKCCYQLLLGACWPSDKEDPFKTAKPFNDWKDASHGVGIKGIDWKNIKAVGIALSSRYVVKESVYKVLLALGLLDQKTDILKKNFDPFFINSSCLSL